MKRVELPFGYLLDVKTEVAEETDPWASMQLLDEHGPITDLPAYGDIETRPRLDKLSLSIGCVTDNLHNQITMLQHKRAKLVRIKKMMDAKFGDTTATVITLTKEGLPLSQAIIRENVTRYALQTQWRREFEARGISANFEIYRGQIVEPYGKHSTVRLFVAPQYLNEVRAAKEQLIQPKTSLHKTDAHAFVDDLYRNKTLNLETVVYGK